MNIEEFDKLLLNYEGEEIEFKLDFSADDRDARTVGAFFNTRGGVLVYGVEEDGKKRIVVGVTLPPQVFESNLINKLKAACPRCKPEVEFVEMGGRTCLVVRCPRGEQPPYDVKGKIYIRRGSNNIEATQEEKIALYRDSNPESYDASVVGDADLSALDLEEARSYLGEKMGRQIVNGDLYNLMERMRFIKKSGGNYKPTIAGLLLFGVNPQISLPHAKIKAEAKFDDNSNNWDDLAEIGGNIFEQIKGAEIFLKRNIKTSARIFGFERIEQMEIPIEALREAVVNALVHRDYAQTGSEVFLRVRKNQVLIENPGGLIPPLTIEEILSSTFIPKTRNPEIAAVLSDLRLMDKRGSGFIRMRKLMEDFDLPSPRFSELSDGFRVEFFSSAHNEEGKPFIPPGEYKKASPDEDQKKILKLIERKIEVSASECEAAIKKSRQAIVPKINDLVSKRLLEPTTSSPRDPRIKYRLHSRFTKKEPNTNNQVDKQQNMFS